MNRTEGAFPTCDGSICGVAGLTGAWTSAQVRDRSGLGGQLLRLSVGEYPWGRARVEIG